MTLSATSETVQRLTNEKRAVEEVMRISLYFCLFGYCLVCTVRFSIFLVLRPNNIVRIESRSGQTYIAT